MGQNNIFLDFSQDKLSTADNHDKPDAADDSDNYIMVIINIMIISGSDNEVRIYLFFLEKLAELTDINGLPELWQKPLNDLEQLISLNRR